MRDLMKKYGYYEFNDGNLYIEVTDEKLVRPDFKDTLISFSGNVIILTATKQFYKFFWEEKYWDDWKDKVDLDGKSVEDVTRLTRFRKKRVINVNWLKLKETEEVHFESTNWTLKILDFETGNLLKNK